MTIGYHVKKYKIDFLISALLSGTVIFLLFYKMGFAPFGNKSLATMDADIQYLDFFAYYKDVLERKNSIAYTFGKLLGGNNVGMFSYYLSSPFNLFVIFFRKTEFHTYFDIRVLVELVLATFSFHYFIYSRFIGYIDNFSKRVIAIILAVSYGLCQYNIAQSSNIMWLDGVYMLPFMLNGVYSLVKNNCTWKLSLSVMLAIIFNWYTAGINCVFTFIWFCFECSIIELYHTNSIFGHILTSITKLLRYVLSMVHGIIMSSFIFIPTIYAFKNSNRGELGFDLLKNIDFAGRIPNILRNYYYGSCSSNGNVALFAGCLGAIGFIACFISKKVNIRSKFCFFILTVATLCSFYFLPEYALFTLLKDVKSYWYRHSYIGIFVILFIATFYYIKIETEYVILLKSGIIFAVLLILSEYIDPIEKYKYIYYTAFVALIISLIAAMAVYFDRKVKKNIKFIYIFLVLICTIEMLYNSKLLMMKYHIESVDEYSEYVEGQNRQIEQIKEMDKGFYRISQSLSRKVDDNGLTANYNEALAYNYWSISSYTSSPDDIQRILLDKMGYRMNGANMCITNAPVIGADSFLGVKYILSQFDISGLKKVDAIDNVNGKNVYENPYSLPIAFLYNKSEISYDCHNPFEYQNGLYSEICGEITQIYKPVNYTVENNSSENTTDFNLNIEVPKGNYILYGNIPWSDFVNAELSVNGKYKMAYSCWLSQSVFIIPTDTNDAFVNVYSVKQNKFKMQDIAIYALDLDLLKKIKERINTRKIDIIDMKNGRIEMNVEASSNDSLFISVPIDTGWKIIINGKKAEVDSIGDCLYSLPLNEGSNKIVMHYSTPGLFLGSIMSFGGVLIFIIVYISNIQNLLIGKVKVKIFHVIKLNEKQINTSYGR